MPQALSVQSSQVAAGEAMRGDAGSAAGGGSAALYVLYTRPSVLFGPAGSALVRPLTPKKLSSSNPGRWITGHQPWGWVRMLPSVVVGEATVASTNTKCTRWLNPSAGI